MFPATIDDRGRLHADAVNATAGRLAKWKGRHVTVTVTRYIKPKTNPQLGLYFRAGGILDCWAEFMGADRDDAHEDMKDAWLRPIVEKDLEPHVNRITGEETRPLPSLADLNVEQMSAYLDRCIREGAQAGITFDLSEGA